MVDHLPWGKVLTEHHDGDDRCGCLREALALLLEHPNATESAKEIVGDCIRSGHRGWPRG